ARQHPLRIALRPFLQHRGQRRPRVLDVHVDLPRTDRRVADERAPEVEPTLRPEPHALDRLREQLAEDALLGEVLRAADDALAASGSSTRTRSWRSVIPIPRPASRIAGSTPSMPVTVLRSTGRSP